MKIANSYARITLRFVAILLGVAGFVGVGITAENSNQSPLTATINLKDAPATTKDQNNMESISNRDSAAARRNMYFYADLPFLGFGLGKQFNPNWGIEGAYYDRSPAGSDCGVQMIFSAGSGCTQETKSFTYSRLSLVGTAHLNDEISLLAKAGVATISASYSYSSTSCFLYFCSASITGSGGATKTNPIYGLEWRKCVLYWNLCYHLAYENAGYVKLTSRYSDGTTKIIDNEIELFAIGIDYFFK